jgi:Na+/melibiose symporter-like transporter
LVVFGCIAYVIAGILVFAAGSNYIILIISFIFTGIAVLPITYLTDIMLLDCATFNEWKSGKRMDGTLASIKNFAGKLGTGFGSLIVGLIMGMSGFDGTLKVQPEAALFSIRALQGLVPAVLFAAVAIMMWFYKLDKIVFDIRKDKESQTISQA